MTLKLEGACVGTAIKKIGSQGLHVLVATAFSVFLIHVKGMWHLDSHVAIHESCLQPNISDLSACNFFSRAKKAKWNAENGISL